MNLVYLPVELLIRALTLCDVSSVISASQVNAALHRICFNHSIWTSLVKDLRYAGFIDRISAQEIQDMSTSQLIALVRRLIVGPDSWTPAITVPSNSSRRKLFEKFTLHPSNPTPPVHAARPRKRIVLSTPRSILPHDGWISPDDFVLLPGGEYMLLRNRTDFGCWRVSDETLIWLHSSMTPGSPYQVDMFAADMLQGEEQLNLFICCRQDNQSPFCLEVINLDVLSGISELLFRAEFRDLRWHSPRHVRILGGLAFVQMEPKDLGETDIDPNVGLAMLFDWHAHLCCTLADVNMLDLVPNYLVSITTTARSRPQLLQVRALSALADHWLPVNRTGALDVSLIQIYTIPVCASHECGTVSKLSVHRSPLARDTFRVWVTIYPWSEPVPRRSKRTRFFGLASRLMPPPPPRPAPLTSSECLLGFQLSAPRTGANPTLQPHHGGPTTLPSFHMHYAFTYAGHSFWQPDNRVAGRWAILSGPQQAQVELAMSENMPKPSVSAYSGAVSCVTEDQVVIEYFE